jgi:hypothetical protein
MNTDIIRDLIISTGRGFWLLHEGEAQLMSGKNASDHVTSHWKQKK